MNVDIQKNRRDRKWSNAEIALRLSWALLHPLFRFSPRPVWWWRRFLLRLMGAKIGPGVRIFPSVRITIPWNIRIDEDAAVGDGVNLYALGKISIGERTTISQFAHICAGSHDYSSRSMKLLKSGIFIGDDAWICADAFIGPGVEIDDRAIVGARAVVTKRVDAGLIVAGNPAEKIGERQIVTEIE